MGKKTRGRQKIEMKKIENIDQLHVAFSKRRHGLMKMANEMCVLTGSQVALVTFSPGNKVFPFGNPDVNLVIDRYENQTLQPLSNTDHDMLVQNTSSTENQLERNSDLSRLENEVLALKKREMFLDQMIEKRKNGNCNLGTLIQDLDLNKLHELLKSAKDLHKDITKEIQNMVAYNLCQGNNISGKNPSGVHNVSSPVMAPTKDLDQNTAMPSILELLSSLGTAKSNELAPINPRDVGSAGIVQFAGPSRINGASEMTPGASSSNPTDSFNSMAPGFDGPDMPQEFN